MTLLYITLAGILHTCQLDNNFSNVFLFKSMITVI